jgi:hypothetical protein
LARLEIILVNCGDFSCRIPTDASTQQPELLYIGLYLLIWGEASNVRFMPECICYIFHHVSGNIVLAYDISAVKTILESIFSFNCTFFEVLLKF